ncbi:MAG: hypothetical protein LC101_00105, partial [Flavobacteriales bacterium]|nr:hypothetical protein [Flavobacteriales bacterium]
IFDNLVLPRNRTFAVSELVPQLLAQITAFSFVLPYILIDSFKRNHFNFIAFTVAFNLFRRPLFFFYPLIYFLLHTSIKLVISGKTLFFSFANSWAKSGV